jgi:hypothetical protein
MMSDENNDGVRPPEHPKMSVEEAKRQYPIAAAYLTILKYSQADPSSKTGFEQRIKGEEAIEKLENGADVEKTRDEMIENYKKVDTSTND